MRQIFFDFYGIIICVESEWIEIIDLLCKDFWSFLIKDGVKSTSQVYLKIIHSDFIPRFPNRVSSMQTQNAITFDQGRMRYCDYYNELYSIINFNNNTAELFSMNLDKMHEVAYLLILSRAGKMLDLKGFHKLHAFAVSYEDVALICMMPSKGGKSTLLAELLKDSRIKMISDDIPLIDTFGNVYPFPLKLGLDSIPLEMQIFEREKNTYSMKRNYYGVKELICTRGLPGKVEPMTSKFKKVILVEAFRYNSPTSILAKSSFLKTFKGLLKHGVIGIGSPIVIEYFWETGFIDFLKKTGIFFLRILAFTSLSVRSKKMQLFLGKNSKNTSQEILNILSGYSQL